MSKISYIQRYMLLIRKVRNTPYCTLNELREYIEEELVKRGEATTGISQRTIERDIRDIRMALGISIDYSRTQCGYHIPADEDGTSDIERILEPFEILCSLGANTGLEAIVFTESRKATGTEHLYRLIHAIKNTRTVTFHYRKYWEEMSSNRTIEPYALKESRGRWYLIGREPGATIEKTFGLDRMSNLEIGNRRFTRDRYADIESRFSHAFGITTSEEAERVVVSFDSKDSRYLKSMPLHHSQRIVKETPQRTTFELTVYITPDFIMELMSRAWSLQIHEPESLKRKICNIYRNGLKLNR